MLEAQHVNEFRVRAYRQAANTLRSLPTAVQTLWLQTGREGLQALPTIGSSLAQAIEQLSTTGHIELSLRLRGETTPVSILATRIHKQLHIATLAEL